MRRFVELRAAGWSYARIAAELNVSKPTLLQWHRSLQADIEERARNEVSAKSALIRETGVSLKSKRNAFNTASEGVRDLISFLASR